MSLEVYGNGHVELTDQNGNPEKPVAGAVVMWCTCHVCEGECYSLYGG